MPGCFRVFFNVEKQHHQLSVLPPHRRRYGSVWACDDRAALYHSDSDTRHGAVG